MEPVHVHIPYPELKDFFELIRARRYDLEIYLSAAVLDQIERHDLEKLEQEPGLETGVDAPCSLHGP